MSSWPASLPQKVPRDGYSEKPGKNVLRTTVQRGPAKLRLLSRAMPDTITMTLKLTEPQVQTFIAFYKANAALPWNWVHPRTQAPVLFRFAGDDPPAPQAISGSLRYSVAMQLEIMP